MRFSQSEVVLHSNASKKLKNLENKTKNVLKNSWCSLILIYTGHKGGFSHERRFKSYYGSNIPIVAPFFAELWGIVNNAGVCFIGNIETMTAEDINKIMSVNIMGPINICRAFFPLLRKSKGRLVNIASNTGSIFKFLSKTFKLETGDSVNSSKADKNI